MNEFMTIISYWEFGQHTGKEGIRNVIARTRFCKTYIFTTMQKLIQVIKVA